MNGPRVLDASADLSISGLILAYWRFAETNYVRGGRPTKELSAIKNAMRPLRRLYGGTMARAFGPLALKTVRQALIESGFCRVTVNA